MSYRVFLNALDSILTEAPKEFKTYHPEKEDAEGVNQARAKAFIHLFLKVRFGIGDFKSRHSFVCDGCQDGGVDAFYIDQESKNITLIQSKFRVTEKNFEEKSIEVCELLRMEITRITKGEKVDSNGVAFSARVLAFQKQVAEIRDIALYKWKVLILANLKHSNDEQIRKLIDNMEYEVFNYTRTYKELLLPLITGTYFNPSEITIKINLGKKTHPQLNQDVEVNLGMCNVRILYVPIIEIARIAAKYRNALLRYNPRNYLSLSGNEVNQSIKDTVINTTKNEFSLRNNGITMLAEYSSVTDRTGKSGEGQLIITDPQILNGGQTATTLAMMCEDNQVGSAVFEGKEVLLKIIERPKDKTEAELAEFIETISDATNKQSKIVEADRRSNDPRMLTLQEYFYMRYGLFLERKRGEFCYGLDDKIIAETDIVDRTDLARALTAFIGEPARARSSESRIFEEDGFDALLKDLNVEKVAKSYFALMAIENRGDKNLIRYAKYAMVQAVGLLEGGKYDGTLPLPIYMDKIVQNIVVKWREFEIYIDKLESNRKYFSAQGFNFDGYYKGATISSDIRGFSWL